MIRTKNVRWLPLASVLVLMSCGQEQGSNADDSGPPTDSSTDDGGERDGGERDGGERDGGEADGGIAGEISLGADNTLQIWTVGDSITEGVNNGYRNRLWTELTADGYAVDLVGTLVHPYPDSACPDPDHDGHSGYTIGNIGDELGGWYSQITAPDVVLVMAGTNDLAWWLAAGTDMSAVAGNMVDLVSDILDLRADLAVIVASIPPMSSDVISDINRDRAELTVEFNQALANAVAAHGQFGVRLWFVDVHAALSVGDLYDGIHPTLDGHHKIADVWLGGLTPRLPAP